MKLSKLSTVSTFKNIDAEKEGYKVLTESELNQLQKKLFEILVEFHDFCEKQGLEYALAGGSALGAVRHNGFIPWDDDIDLLMPRTSYDRLREIFEEEMGHRYWLHTPESTKGYGLGFARIRRKGTICRAREDVGNDECGIYIDIFIVENTYDNKALRKLHGLLSSGCGFGLSCRVFLQNRQLYLDLAKGNEELARIFKTKIRLGRCCSFLSVDRWTSLWNRVNRMCKKTSTGWVVVPTGRKHFFGECYPRERLFPADRHDFRCFGENMELCIMKDYDYYLTQLYGNYMQLPKKEDIEKHIVLELKF